MDLETLRALIAVYKAHASTDLLSIVLDETGNDEARATVLELLRSLTAGALAEHKFAPVRRKATRFAIAAEDFELADRLAKTSDLPEDKVLRARALFGLGRTGEAIMLYRQAIAEEPAVRNRDFERQLDIKPGAPSGTVAKVIPLTTYSSKRDPKAGEDRREGSPDGFEDLDEDGALSFADIAGLDDIKAEIRQRIVLPYLKPSLFEKFKLKPGGNMLLYGPPGCGKTMIARATAGESDARFLSVNAEDILDKYAGEAEKRLRFFFDEARSDTPAILFFNDFDILAAPRPAGIAGTGLTAALLSELDRHQRNNAGVLVMAATNAPWTLDPGFLRSGRFGRASFVPPPDAKARKKILSNALSSVPGVERINLDRIARHSEGYSGADLRSAAEWACEQTLRKTLAGASASPVTTALLEEGLRMTGPSAARWMREARGQLRARRDQDICAIRFAPLLKR